MKLLCRFGLHAWSPWVLHAERTFKRINTFTGTESGPFTDYIYVRECTDCKEPQSKIVEPTK